MSLKESVNALRKKIDQVDEKIITLLNERALLASEVGQAKGLEGQGAYAPGREKEIYLRLSGLNSGPLPERALRSIYREILSASRSLEAPIKIAYLGPEATFAHMAAQGLFGASATYIPALSIPDVFHEVRQLSATYGIVPIENSTEGVITHTLDMLVEADLKICAEVSSEIHLHLLSLSGRSEDIRRIVSHPQPLAQSRRWLATHCPGIELDEVASTAQAARIAAKDGEAAAIASSLAKEFYGLKLVKSNIEDHASNMTRFLVVGHDSPRPSGDDKTSVVFSVKDEVGILHRMLAPFAKNRINLTKIESRPIKDKPWEYLFFLDFEGHIEEARVRRAVKQLEKSCLFVKVLGSYPCGVR